MKREKFNILITSAEPWGEVWFSKHHYANELSNLGHKVYFINPPSKWKVSNFFIKKIRILDISENLSVIKYTNCLPSFKHNSLFSKVNNFVTCFQLSRYFNKYSNLIFWSFDPFRFFKLHFLDLDYIILHIVDKYSIDTDLQFAETADLIVLVTKAYIEKYQSFSKKLIHIPHGVSSASLQVEQAAVSDLKNTYGDYIIFVGTINNQVDIDLLHKLTDSCSNNLLMLGPVCLTKKKLIANFERLCDKENLQYFGPIHANLLKNYIGAAKVCIIPYIIEAAYRVQTLKALQYLALNKPIVSIELSDLVVFRDKLVFMANGHSTFIEHVENLMNNKYHIDTKASEAYIKDNMYISHIEKIFKSIENA